MDDSWVTSEPEMIEDSKLISALEESGAIDQEDIDRGRELSEESGRPLYHTLIDHDLADELTVVRIAAEILNVPFVELSDIQIRPDVLEKIPPSLAFRNIVFPLKIEEGDEQRELYLAMADPLDVLAMDEIATHTGIDIHPVLAGPRDIRSALEAAYQADDTDSKVEDIEPFGEDFNIEDIESVDDASDLNEDSWEAFFDEAEEAEEEELEDSMVLSREMRDRRTSQELEPLQGPIDEDDSESESDEDDALQSLEEPLSQSQATGGVETDLSQWEIDQRLEGEDSEAKDGKKDYAAIGSFFVYSSEDERQKRLKDIGEFDESDEGDERTDDEDPDGSEASRLGEESSGVVSGVTSMSKAPFMFEDDDADDDSGSTSVSAELDAKEKSDVDLEEDSDGLEEDSDGHTVVGRGLNSSDATPDDNAAASRVGDEASDSGTSMLGAPFGVGMDEVSSDVEGLGEESSGGGRTMVGGVLTAEDVSESDVDDADILADEELELLDDDDVEMLEESSAGEEDDVGSETQFGVGPSGAASSAATSDDDALDGKDDEQSDTSAGSAQSRLSGLLDKVRGKNRKNQSDSGVDEPASSERADGDEADGDEAGEVPERARDISPTKEDPAAEAEREQLGDEESVRETRPNRAVTFLRAKAMQEEAGLASIFAKHIAEISDLSHDEAAALTELDSDELIYVTLLALFEKGALTPEDILAQFGDGDDDT